MQSKSMTARSVGDH